MGYTYESALSALYLLKRQKEITQAAYNYYAAAVAILQEDPDEAKYKSFDEIILEADDC